MLKNKLMAVSFLCGLSFTAMGCGLKNSDGTGTFSDSSDSPAYVVDSAVAAINGALNDSELRTSYAQKRSSWSPSEAFIPSAYAATCDVTRFSPSIGSTTCTGFGDGKTVTETFNECTASQNSSSYSLKGTISLSFDSNATCSSWVNSGSLPTSGNLIRTTASFIRTNSTGSTVNTNSVAHTNYNGDTVTGGVKVTFGSASRNIDVLGLHRTRYTSSGSVVYEHSIRTTSPLIVTGSRASNNRAILSGTIQVDHNISKTSAIASLSGLKWSSGCCLPTSGQITFALSGAASGSWVAAFSSTTCGQLKLTDASNNTTTYQLSSCE